MPYPTIIEQYGSRSATGGAEELTFGTPVTAVTFLPMTGNTMEVDPGWFSPELMLATRDLHVFNLYGMATYKGTIDGPIFPSNAMMFTAGSIGKDAAPGYGVTGSTPTSATTLAAGITAGTNTFTLTSASGYSVGSIIQVDTNNPATPTTTEVRKILTLVGVSGTVDSTWGYAHANGAAVAVVVAPFLHTFAQQNMLPSFTIEKNLGSFQSLQFAGCRIGKMTLKAPTANEPITGTWDLSGQSAAILNSPTAVTVANESPWVFAECAVTLFSNARADVSSFEMTIDNGLKETYTFSGNHGPSFITPVTLHVNGTMTVVWSSLNNGTYGDFTNMVNGTLGALVFTATHPNNLGTLTVTMPQVVLSKFGNDVKMTDVIMSALTYEATKSLSSGYTIQATLASPTVYTAF